jgi:hypothetical protein
MVENALGEGRRIVKPRGRGNMFGEHRHIVTSGRGRCRWTDKHRSNWREGSGACCAERKQWMLVMVLDGHKEDVWM